MRSLTVETLPLEKNRALPATPSLATPTDRSTRLVSLDAYRGFIMLAMASAGFSIPLVARELFRNDVNAHVTILLQTQPLAAAACTSYFLTGPQYFPGSSVWQFLAYQTDHVPWVGCAFWDLIQPSFMFMVGVAIPYSLASRRARGDSNTKLYSHALYRSLILILLAVFLSSPYTPRVNTLGWAAAAWPASRFITSPNPHTHFVFVNVLAQIGLGYFFVVLLQGRGFRAQLAALVAILVGYTLLFGLYPLPSADFDFRSVGLPENWVYQTGWFAHWEKNTNAAAAFDLWFLNLFPHVDSFRFNVGGYQTLNFIPSMATMILGLMAGEMLRGPRSSWNKFTVLVGAAVVCLALGWLSGQFICPIVKRIWTPSWALFSAGWTFAFLAAFYWIIDLQGYRRWAFPLIVVGMNSIAMYCMSQLMKGWVAGRLKMHLGYHWFQGTYGPIVQSASILLVLWLVCLWMYRRKIFLRI